MSLDAFVRSADVVVALGEFERAREALFETMRRQFPVGSLVVWKRGKSLFMGKVLEHAYGDQLFALNLKTQKRVKIGSYEIREAAFDGAK